MDSLTLGDKVTVSAKLIRRTAYENVTKGNGYIDSERRKYWDRKDIEPVQAVFIGYRTLKNGVTDYDSDYGWYFNERESFKAALVCSNVNENPYYIPLDAIQEGW